jgi:hypothetical protein
MAGSAEGLAAHDGPRGLAVAVEVAGAVAEHLPGGGDTFPVPVRLVPGVVDSSHDDTSQKSSLVDSFFMDS